VSGCGVVELAGGPSQRAQPNSCKAACIARMLSCYQLACLLMLLGLMVFSWMHVCRFGCTEVVGLRSLCHEQTQPPVLTRGSAWPAEFSCV
jgi:hypothetical protein